jgi:DNA-binding MarR family transcriptional regulator
VSQLIDGLHQLGYITRQTGDKDRRVTYFGLTKSGEDKVVELEKRRLEYLTSITGTLDDEELDVIVKLQQKMINKIKHHQAEKAKELAKAKEKETIA